MALGNSASGKPTDEIHAGQSLEFGCARCKADPQPEGFNVPRSCAFVDGTFAADNWNCATIDALIALPSTQQLQGDGEEMHAVYSGHYGGWILLTRYKRRGKTSAAIHIGDFYPPQPLTIHRAEQFIAGTEIDWDEIEDNGPDVQAASAPTVAMQDGQTQSESR
jgi:hypothetical protein